MIKIVERQAASAGHASAGHASAGGAPANPLQGFDWEIEQTPIYNEKGQAIAGYKAIWNNKSRQLLNVAKTTYTPTTNAEFWDMVTYISDVSGYKISSFGDIDGGRKVIAGLKKTEQSNMIGLDFEEYIVLGNAHDYSSAFFVGSSHMMVRCSNMFTEQNKAMKAYHTTSHKSQLKQIKGILASYEAVRARQRQAYENFERTRIKTEDKDKLIRHVLGIPAATPIHEISAIKNGQVLALNDSIRNECKDLGNNVLGLFQGVTHYTTHKMRVKEPVLNNTFGSPANANAKAYEFCQELIK
jgi:hypothetical protein